MAGASEKVSEPTISAERKGQLIRDGNDNQKFTVTGDWLLPDIEFTMDEDEVDFDDLLDRFLESKKLPREMKTKLKGMKSQVEVMYNELVNPDGRNCPGEIARDLCLLVLYDLIVLVDDSSTMNKKHKKFGNTTRIQVLQKVLGQICDIYQIARPDGINAVRFLNCAQGRSNFKKGNVEKLSNYSDWSGVTRIGTELKKKILDREVFNGKMLRQREKPLLVIVITDGEVEGEQKGLVERVIIESLRAIRHNQPQEPGLHVVNYLFTYVGEDIEAEQFLKRLSSYHNLKKKEKHHDPEFGDILGCLLNVNLELINNPDLKWAILSSLLLGGIFERWKTCEIIEWDCSEGDNDEAAEDDECSDVPCDD